MVIKIETNKIETGKAFLDYLTGKEGKGNFVNLIDGKGGHIKRAGEIEISGGKATLFLEIGDKENVLRAKLGQGKATMISKYVGMKPIALISCNTRFNDELGKLILPAGIYGSFSAYFKNPADIPIQDQSRTIVLEISGEGKMLEIILKVICINRLNATIASENEIGFDFHFVAKKFFYELKENKNVAV